MKDNVVQVNLWDKNVGLLSWDDKRSCSVFQFDKDFMQYGWNIGFFSNFGTFMYLSLRRPLSVKEKSMLFHP